jgi:hypothetical protein
MGSRGWMYSARPCIGSPYQAPRIVACPGIRRGNLVRRFQYILRAPLAMQKLEWDEEQDTVSWKSSPTGYFQGKHLLRRYGLYASLGRQPMPGRRASPLPGSGARSGPREGRREGVCEANSERPELGVPERSAPPWAAAPPWAGMVAMPVRIAARRACPRTRRSTDRSARAPGPV